MFTKPSARPRPFAKSETAAIIQAESECVQHSLINNWWVPAGGVLPYFLPFFGLICSFLINLRRRRRFRLAVCMWRAGLNLAPEIFWLQNGALISRKFNPIFSADCFKSDLTVILDFKPSVVVFMSAGMLVCQNWQSCLLPLTPYVRTLPHSLGK